MSSHYNLEPQPTGSVIIHTTAGELGIELFAKQTPLTCRNFLQHSLDGYYDNTIFHRLVPGFIIQGGDPTGTGNGGECIYDGGAFGGDLDPWPLDQRRGANAGPHGVGLKDEFHSRLKFNRRGLLAMANEGKADSNGSQFFFTLDKTEELTRKNTLFGRVVGDTIYNLMRMGEAEVIEGTDRPEHPVRIERIEILENPFTDMKKRMRIAERAVRDTTESRKAEAKSAEQKKKKRALGKHLLSFAGDDDDDDDDDVLPIVKKMKYESSATADGNNTPLQPSTSRHHTLVSDDGERLPERPKPVSKERHGMNATESQNEKLPRKPTPSVKSDSDLESSDEEEQPQKMSALEQTKAEIAALRAEMRKERSGAVELDTSNSAAKKQQDDAIAAALMPDNAIRGRKRRKNGADNAASEAKTLGALNAWMSKLDKTTAAAAQKSKASARPSTIPNAVEGATKEHDGQSPKINDAGNEDEADVCDLHFISNCMSCRSWIKDPGNAHGEASDDDAGDWMANALKAAPNMLGKDLNDRNRRKAEQDDGLIVIDPRERAKTLKEGRSKRSNQEKGGREWDRARDQAKNARMARASALAGRGAR